MNYKNRFISEIDPCKCEVFPVAFQIGYGEHYLVATSTVMSPYDKVKVTFVTREGGIPLTIFLSPCNKTETNIYSGLGCQRILIRSITLTTPTCERNGSVYLEIAFTNHEGKNERTFNGNIATWTINGPSRC